LKGDVAMGFSRFANCRWTASVPTQAGSCKALHEVNIVVACQAHEEEPGVSDRVVPNNVGAGERPATGHHYPQHVHVQVIEVYDMARQHLKKSCMASAFVSPRHKLFGLQT